MKRITLLGRRSDPKCWRVGQVGSRNDALLAVSEARLPKQAWELATMDPNRRETMLAAIRVIDIVIDEVEGQSKLNQHKSDEDHVAIADRLARAQDSASRLLARKMRALQPGLAYEFTGEG